MALTKLTSVDKSVAKKLLSELPIQVSTVAEMKTKSYEVGQVVETVGYYAEGDSGAARYLVKAAQAFDGYGDHELANNNIAVLQVNGVADIRQFGAIDNQDNTAELQAVFSSTNVSNIILSIKSLITSECTIARDLTISFYGDGELILNSDIDFMVKQNSGNVKISNWKARDNTSYASRTNLHRGYRSDGTSTTTSFTGLTRSDSFNTAIHSNQTRFLSVGDYELLNIYGTEPQEGYGLNTSAKITLIGDGSVDNTAITNAHGRHVIYINADFEYVSIGTLYVNNFNRNPIQINPDPQLEARVTIGKQIYEAVQVDPVSDRAGAINLTVNDSSSTTDVTVEINGLLVDGYDGCLVSCAFGGYPKTVIKNVRGRNNRKLVDETTFNAIHLANMISPIVDDVEVEELVNNSVSVVRSLSGTTNPRISNIKTSSQVGRSVVGISDTQGYVIDAIDSTGATPIDRLDVINTSTGKMTTNYNTDYRTISSSDLTPNVRDLQKILYSTATPITVTGFDNGEGGQELFVFASQGNVTIAASSTIDTINGNHISLGNREIAHFIKQGSRWIEVGY